MKIDKTDKIKETLQMEIALPAVVQQRADAVFEQIQRSTQEKEKR